MNLFDRKKNASPHISGTHQEGSASKPGLARALERTVYCYTVIVLIPSLFIAGSYYLTPLLKNGFEWTSFNIFPLNFIIFSFLFLTGSTWIVWALETGPQRHRTGLSEGPYAYTRNPKAFGYLIVLFGFSIALQSAVALFVLFPASVLACVIFLRFIEEPLLRLRHGNAFEQYRKRVPMLIPLPSFLRKFQ